MKKNIAIVTAFGLASILMAATGFAADLPAPPPTPAPIYTKATPSTAGWTGFYIGGSVGGSWSESNSVTASTTSGSFIAGQPNAGIFAANFASLTTGSLGTGSNGSFIGGGQIGYNWQSGKFVTGIEFDIQGLANRNSNGAKIGQLADQFGNTITATTLVGKSLDYLDTVRGRLGFLPSPTLLLYGTGGLAFGGVKSNISITEGNGAAFLGNAFAANSVSDTRLGWTAGLGLEWMFAPNWSAKAEYLYYDLGNVTYAVGAIAPILQGGAIGSGNAEFVNNVTASTRFNGSVGRVGINYHF